MMELTINKVYKSRQFVVWVVKATLMPFSLYISELFFPHFHFKKSNI